MYISLSKKFGDSQSKMRSSAQKSYISSGVPQHRWKSWMISSRASWAQSIARAILARDLVGWIESEQNHNQSLDSLDFFVGSLLCIRELTALSRKTRICYCILDSLHCIAKPQSMLEGNHSALNARQLALRHLQSDFHCQCRRLQWSSASSTQWYEKRVHCIHLLYQVSFTQLNEKWQWLIRWTATRRAVKATAVLGRIAYLQVIKWRSAGSPCCNWLRVRLSEMGFLIPQPFSQKNA